ncbi:formate--tetrahydrofolate ligase [Telmatocola sphagniphila]|uniref:Formate--tetrahydrofolate ligase n=1 Tax=Telmatocola sphagniphila TaxID=1123043 RepID=A0A8E6B4J3_9BACT|nr:formate--tetrahydrofolate ligase [Telmatocola sphagniphila]QVL31782.1 formate--tetrahydrofolate ligase [Telmatocola sphagniphila]
MSLPTESKPPVRIDQISAELGLGPNDVEPYGWYKGKLALGLERRLPERPGARYIVVTAVSPTPLGEGKTVTSIGLTMGLCRLGKKAIACLRQPSQAPVFGIKGGGAGGGRSTLVPTTDINTHFTGDIHAVAAAHNLLAAVLDNHVKRRLQPLVDPATVTWRRVLDVNDKGLSRIITGLGDLPQAPLRETGFDLTAASEVMAILALTTSLEDLRARLGRIIVARAPDGSPITAEAIRCAGAMAALLRDAIRPNLVQTCEGGPALVHAGPFANIAHGNSSVLADLAALKMADYVVTEAGFGSDAGAEKMFDIKCRVGGLRPNVAVIVCTLRALKLHSGRFALKPGRPLDPGLLSENLDALHAGAVNLQAHLDIVRRFGLPAVVAINRFPDDSPRELEVVRKLATDWGARGVAVSEGFARGSEGTTELAQAVVDACASPSDFRPLYDLQSSAEEKIDTLATQLYGADGVDYEPLAKKRLAEYAKLGFGQLPVCIAKTQYSLSHDPHLLGRPRGFRFPIRDVRLAAGAGFLYALAGEISTMPGLPTEPSARRIDVDKDGHVTGM